MAIKTYADAIDAGVAFMQAGGGGSIPTPSIAMAVNAAMARLHSARRWSWMQYSEQAVVGGVYTEGTVSYSADTGQYVLSGGTWPSWAVGGVVSCAGTFGLIGRRRSGTICEAHPLLAPPVSVSSQPYVLYRCGFPLKTIASIDSLGVISPSSSRLVLRSLDNNELVALLLRSSDTAEPSSYSVLPSILGDQRIVLVAPLSAVPHTLLATGSRVQVPLTVSGLADQDQAGKVTLTSGSSAVSGASTQFHAGHVGAILSIGTATARVGGQTGLSLPVWQSSIANVFSATSLSLTTAPIMSHTSVYYRISTPLLLPDYAWPVLVLLLQSELAVMRAQKNAADITSLAMMALRNLANDDSAHSGTEIMGARSRGNPRNDRFGGIVVEA